MNYEISNDASKENDPSEILSAEPNFEDRAKNAKTLMIGDEVYSGYKIASMPFEEKAEAYDEIKKYWQGEENVTTYFDNGSWYIITK